MSGPDLSIFELTLRLDDARAATADLHHAVLSAETAIARHAAEPDAKPLLDVRWARESAVAAKRREDFQWARVAVMFLWVVLR